MVKPGLTLVCLCVICRRCIRCGGYDISMEQLFIN